MIALWLALAWGHPLSPSVLRLEEADGAVVATWREPAARPRGDAVAPELPCGPAGEPVVALSEGVVETTWTLDCPTVDGLTVAIGGLDAGRNALVEWVRPDGTTTELLHGGRHEVRLERAARTRSGLLAAGRTGVAHLFAGADHLLFLGGLALLLPARRLVAPVTSFTVGHAMSLALVGLGWLTLPSGPVEVGIALSLLWLAGELATGAKGWIAERPTVLCGGFGLLHGLGFAGAWREAGLGDSGLVVGLLGFNLGIELAQLAVIGLCAGLLAWRAPGEVGRTRLAWVGGAVASMWVWERLAALV